MALRFLFYFQDQTELRDGQKIKTEITLLSEPKTSAKTQKFYVSYKASKIYVTTTPFPEYHYGDNLIISGKLQIRMLNDDKFFLLNFPKIEIKNENRTAFLAITSSIRQKITSIFQSSLPPNSSGLLLGIVFGIKEAIPSDFYGILRTSGTLHVTAASGMNVTMVGGFLTTLFSLFLRRQIAVFAAILGILFYAALAGFEASIVRASIMGILVFSSQIIGRQNFAVYSLFLTGFAMLLFDPNTIFDIGFQLSFLATAGILFVQPLFSFRNKFLGSDLATTLSAQIAVLPILFSNFGTYSIFSVFTNFLVLWTIPLIMVLGGLAGFLGFVLEPLTAPILYLSLPLLLYFEKVVSFFASFGQISLANLNIFLILGYYVILIATLVFLKSKST